MVDEIYVHCNATMGHPVNPEESERLEDYGVASVASLRTQRSQRCSELVKTALSILTQLKLKVVLWGFWLRV